MADVDRLQQVPRIDSFEEVTQVWVMNLLGLLTEEWQQINRDFYDGEHWSPGDVDASGWIGPVPPIDEPEASAIMAKVQAGFISSNKIKEIVDRLIDALLSRQANMGMTVRRPMADDEAPTAAEQTLIDEAQSLLDEWWDDRDALEIFREFLRTIILEERGVLRYYVPRAKAPQGVMVLPPNTPQADRVREAMFRIWLHHCRPQQAAVYMDLDAMEEVGVYAYVSDQKDYVEVTWVDEGGLTVIRELESGTQDTAGASVGDEGYETPGLLWEVRLDFGRRRTIHEGRHTALISEQVRSSQKLVNKSLTMMSGNLDTGGFLERTVLNGQMPGHYEPDDTAPRGRVWVPDPAKMGAGRTTYIAGFEQEDDEGNVTYTTPQLMYKEPSPIQVFKESKDSGYITMLEEVQQLHAALSGEALPSGEARIQAMAGFITSVLGYKNLVDKAGRWALETLLGMAAAFGGDPGRYNELRAAFDCRIDPGPIPPDLVRLISERYEKRLLSRRSAMSLQGVDDPDAEIDAMNAEDEEAMARGQSIIGGEGDQEGVGFDADDDDATDVDDQEE